LPPPGFRGGGNPIRVCRVQWIGFSVQTTSGPHGFAPANPCLFVTGEGFWVICGGGKRCVPFRALGFDGASHPPHVTSSAQHPTPLLLFSPRLTFRLPFILSPRITDTPRALIFIMGNLRLFFFLDPFSQLFLFFKPGCCLKACKKKVPALVSGFSSPPKSLRPHKLAVLQISAPSPVRILCPDPSPPKSCPTKLMGTSSFLLWLASRGFLCFVLLNPCFKASLQFLQVFAPGFSAGTFSIFKCSLIEWTSVIHGKFCKALFFSGS